MNQERGSHMPPPTSHHLLSRQEEILCLEDCLEIARALEEISRGQYRSSIQRLSLRLLWLLSRYPESSPSAFQMQEERLRLRRALLPDQEQVLPLDLSRIRTLSD